MKRPNRNDYDLDFIYRKNEYVNKLEEYCNHLERVEYNAKPILLAKVPLGVCKEVVDKYYHNLKEKIKDYHIITLVEDVDIYKFEVVNGSNKESEIVERLNNELEIAAKKIEIANEYIGKITHLFNRDKI